MKDGSVVGRELQWLAQAGILSVLRVVALSVAVSVFALAVASRAQAEPGLSGRVTTPDGRGLGAVAVHIRGPATDLTVESNADGEFHLDLPTAGRYGLLAEKEGFNPSTRTILVGGGAEQIVMVLIPAPNGE